MLINIILLFITIIFLVFNLGYRMGKERGKKILLHTLPLYYLELSLKNGCCPICGEKDMERIDEEGN